MSKIKYSGTTSSGGVITTTVENQKIYFYDPYDMSTPVEVKSLYLESVTPFNFSFNNELVIHKLEGNGASMEIEGMNVSHLVIKEVGSQLRYEALI